MIQRVLPQHLPYLQALVNDHIGALIPGWAMSLAHLEQHLHSNPYQPIIDPWVIERETLLAFDRQRVVAAAHLLHYGASADVGEDYQQAVDIGWFVFRRGSETAARELLAACHEQAHAWQARRVYAFNSQLPLPMYGGIPDIWAHIGALFDEAGYTASQAGAVFGGTFEDIPAATPKLPAGLRIERGMGGGMRGVRFAAFVGAEQVGFIDWETDLTRGGALPALQGWAELAEIYIEEAWRNQKIGLALVQHSLPWLKLACCDRVMLNVDTRDEAEGAGRFYQRLGWTVWARFRDAWIAPAV